MSQIPLRPARADEAAECEAILRALPDWFGIESAIVGYRRDIEQMETLVAEQEGSLVAFITLNTHDPHAAEVQVIGIRPEAHRCGIGRAMMQHAEALLASRGIEFLQVKTLGPSWPDANYEKTRSFYEAMGFRPVEESDRIWEGHPCLVMIKHLACTRRGEAP